MRFKVFQRLKSDLHFRIKAFLCVSIAFNLAYACFLWITGWIYHSKWFFVMSVYYGLLVIARIFIFVQIDPKERLRSKLLTMRTCGYFLLLINLVVSTMIFILLYGGHSVKHHEITVITLATYTFSSLTVAIVNSIKYYKKNAHVYFCAKLIGLISASVSLITLTNTMLATFGEDTARLRSIVLPILSVAVSIFIIASATLMIRKANLDFRELKNEKER